MVKGISNFWIMQICCNGRSRKWLHQKVSGKRCLRVQTAQKWYWYEGISVRFRAEGALTFSAKEYRSVSQGCPHVSVRACVCACVRTVFGA